jgi:formylglycine-generating enzyme required for sulfatase activity
VDRHLRQLEQQLRREPANPELRSRLSTALQRLADLGDRERWNQADPAAQDIVIHFVGTLLGATFTFSGTARFEAGGQVHRVGSFRHHTSGVVLCLLPGGRYRMGDPDSGQSRSRRVAVPPLLLGRYPVLQAEWDAVGGEDDRSWKGQTLPIEGVSWREVSAWLLDAGDGLRLPSESEWEYGCRAGTETRFFWGERMDRRYCWFGEPAEVWTTHPPSEHDAFPNAFGLVDMSGNVHEWCQDSFGPYQAGMPTDGRPHDTPLWTSMRVLRGGDGFNPASHCRSAHRNGAHAGDRGGGLGFRVARDVPLWERASEPPTGRIRRLLRWLGREEHP